ncbi:glycoside hydrolase [Stereum hirsutum FP-91666 SS1]|uniref:glycoside hydrolase n=1 Tax=Stereum hirsutum (strain FP-91666) TaxID=721885 RepID=UPI000440E591|nr:glycoside hydrolase [Stereum hirsutum FP-91666 SS1]EIM87573.1 glycoside hydrolase [Stereum hirsutum FP-91666 SS1]
MFFTSPRTLAPLAALAALVGFTSIITEVRAVDYSTDAVVVPLDLSSYLNNKGTSDAPGQADLNGEGWSIPYAGFPTGNLTYRGIQFSIPDDWSSVQFDNVLCEGQDVNLPSEQVGRYQSLYLLTTADSSSPFSNNISVTYADGTSVSGATLIPPWQSWPFPSQGVLNSNFTYTNNGTDGNTTSIHVFQLPLDASKTLNTITLPTANSSTRLHIFAATLWSSSSLLSLTNNTNNTTAPSPALAFEYIRSRTNWFNDSGSTTSIVQVYDIAISNLPLNFTPSSWLIGNYTVEIESDQVSTEILGTLKRLRPGDQARVKVGVVNKEGVGRGTMGSAVAVVRDETGSEVARSGGFEVMAGIPVYTDEWSSLALHEAPKWMEDYKFGIFVHWGVYSVPAFAPSGQQYAEWYWWDLHVPNNSDSATWVYHKKTYGEEFLYDDFIPQFNPQNFSADSLVDLFASAGAKYFTIVTKHHDGFAMFDAGDTTNRSSVILGPKRDFLKEIFDAAEANHPGLVPATYFSTPEWYNPDWAPYGKDSWPGGLAHNAYNWSEIEPYTGWIPVDDYIQDLQTPQIKTLFNDYGTNVLWCDIGEASNISLLTADWYNAKYNEGKGVAIDDRCAFHLWDFSTPDANYMTPEVAVPMLVDIVSKNGNWLLDIGPKGDGTVVEPEITTLTAIGDWLSHSGAAIYGTYYWFRTPQESTSLRFTTTDSAFYITTLVSPSPSFKVVSPVPVLPTDIITLLGGSGTALNFTIGGPEEGGEEEGVLTVHVSAEEAGMVKYAWAFEVKY